MIHSSHQHSTLSPDTHQVTMTMIGELIWDVEMHTMTKIGIINPNVIWTIDIDTVMTAVCTREVLPLPVVVIGKYRMLLMYKCFFAFNC